MTLTNICPVNTARWDLYSRCNLNCIHCSAEGLFDQNHDRCLDFDQIREMLDIFRREGIHNLIILGKEPFCHPDIIPILRHACNRGFNIDITTNGTLLNENAIAELLDMGIRSIFFSIDGASEKINDAIRGKGVFNKTVRALETAIAQRELRGSSTMINVNTVLTKINAPDIMDVVGLCAHRKVDLFKLIHMMDIGNADINRNRLYISPKNEFAIAEQIVSHIPEYPDLGFDILSDKPLFLEYFYKKFGAEFPVRVSGCKACKKEIYVSPGGDISPCLATSPGFGNRYTGVADPVSVNLFDHGQHPVGNPLFFKALKQDFFPDSTGYSGYVPCNGCPYLLTICYPCPLDSIRGFHTEDLCAIAQEKMMLPQEDCHHG